MIFKKLHLKLLYVLLDFLFCFYSDINLQEQHLTVQLDFQAYISEFIKNSGERCICYSSQVNPNRKSCGCFKKPKWLYKVHGSPSINICGLLSISTHLLPYYSFFRTEDLLNDYFQGHSFFFFFLEAGKCGIKKLKISGKRGWSHD